MSRLTRLFAAAVLFACASLARGESLRLVAPASGATLRGGAFAELRWDAKQIPPAAEEWEAFLSVDGGKYYAFRVTPHLDIDLRRFTFAVPNVDTHNARILIRAGDEVHESHFEAAYVFAIVRDPNADRAVTRVLHLERGEAAREGDPAVVAWADGGRDGANVSELTSNAGSSHSICARTRTNHEASPVLTPAARLIETPSIVASLSIADTRTSSVASIAISSDLLLLGRRRNV